MVQMIILGIVQGLTEFLPVSSSAHLIFTEHFLGIPRPGVLLEAVLHLGTALAAIVLFWPDLRRLLRAFFTRGSHLRVAWLIVLVTVITGAIGLVFAGPFERMFQSVRGTAVQLIITGFILILARERGRRALLETTGSDPTAAAMWTGMAREEAARFSFLVAIPAIIGAGVFSLRDLPAAASLGYTASQLLVGFAVSAVFGAIATRWLLDVIRRGRLAAFAVYCWVVGLVVFLSTFR